MNKNVILVEPTIEEYCYEEKVLSDPNTMSYNAGFDVSYAGYHYDTGCIDFPKSKWEAKYNRRKEPNCYFAYIKDIDLNEFVGYVNYQLNSEGKYDCGIVIEDKYRNQGYARISLNLLLEQARKSGITSLYDSFEIARENTLKLFTSVGFKVVEKKTIRKFNQDVESVIVSINL